MIDPITGAALNEALAGITNAMAGESLADAYNSRITGQFSTDGPVIGYADYTSDTPAISGNTSNSIKTSTESDPVDAWDGYVQDVDSNVSEETGGIVSGSNVGTFVYSLLEDTEAGENVVKAVAPVMLTIDNAITAISQAAGVSMDAANLDAETKRSLVDSYLSVSGAFYDKAKGLVTAWKDQLGRILFPKAAFDAVANEIDELGIGKDNGYEYDGLDTLQLTQPIRRQEIISIFKPNTLNPEFDPYLDLEFQAEGPGTVFYRYPYGDERSLEVDYVFATRVNNGVVGYRRTQNRTTGEVTGTELRASRSYTYEGRTVYYYSGKYTMSGYDATVYGYDAGVQSYYLSAYAGQAAWIMLYGNYIEGGYPDGTSKSEADESFDPGTIPVVGAVASAVNPVTGNLDTIPVVPIRIPDNPADSTGDTANPTGPTDNDNPGVLAPPIPLPIPDTNVSNPDVPLVDSSVVNSTLVDELVEELANTLDPQAPQSSGIIPFPPLPSIEGQYPSIIPASGSGLIHVYNPTPGEMVSFGNWLWVTYADATIDKIWNNPFDGIIGAFELYSTPQTDGTDNIRSGFLTCPTTAKLVRQRYTEIDCGTVIVPEFYGNYLDYSPYSQAYIYLPFIGINEVSIDDIVGHAVNIRYRIDAYNGSCIAMIYVAKNGYRNLCYQFAGNCAVEVPLAGGSQAAIKAGVLQAEAYARASLANAAISAASQIGAGIASGSVAGIVMGALGGLGTAAAGAYGASQSKQAARVANKSTVQHSGQFGASHGAMGLKIPHIIIRNPIQVKVVNYNEDYGFPAHKRVIVGGCRGYLRVREVNVISAHATDDEKALIEALLKNGVYVS